MGLLITGATGSVGLEVLRDMPAQGEPVYLLIRARDEDHLQARFQELMALAEREDSPRFRPLRGDICAPGLGLDPAVARQITAILHSAADVRFNAPLAESRAANVGGTRQVLDFALRCPRLERFGHVSTTFVAGRRLGLVPEDRGLHDAGFVTSYEQSKYEAERLVETYEHRLPVAVYRPSLLLGRATDGYIHRYGAMHLLLRGAYKGLVAMIPGEPSARVDVLPTDIAGQAIWRLFDQHFQAGARHHVCAGPDAMTLQDFADPSAVFAESNPQWRSGAFCPPAIVDRETWELYIESVHMVGSPVFLRMLRVLDSCVEHALYPKVFARDSMDALVGAPPSWRETWSTILRRAVAEGFRKPRR